LADIGTQIADAIRAVQAKVHWRPGSAERHLQKRKLRGHLPADATLDDYARVIRTVAHRQTAQVYVYRHNDTSYVALVAVVENRYWLVMFDLDGLIESAFVVERPDRYLSKSAFVLAGTVGEVQL
jgi:hypothetical protein